MYRFGVGYKWILIGGMMFAEWRWASVRHRVFALWVGRAMFASIQRYRWMISGSFLKGFNWMRIWIFWCDDDANQPKRLIVFQNDMQTKKSIDFEWILLKTLGPPHDQARNAYSLIRKNESSPGRSMNWPHITQHAAYKATSPNQIITKSTMLLRSSNQKVYNHCVVLHIWLYDSMKKCYSCYLLHVLPVSYHNNGAQQNTHSSFGINNNVRHSHVTAIILCSISNTIHKHPTVYPPASIYADHYLYLSQWKHCLTEAPRSP